MTKRSFSGFLSALLVCLLLAGGASARAERIRIGVSVATMQEAVYSFMKKAMEEQVRKDDVELIWLSAENDEAKQVSDVENLLARKVKAVILHSVNTGAARRLVEMIQAKKLPVVAMDRLPTAAAVDIYVTADSFKVGQLQAEYTAKQIKGKGNVVILEGEAGNTVAAEITRGNKDILKKFPGIQIAVDQAHRAWARDAALATTENALTRYGGKIAAVLANNSGMAMGAVQALLAKKLTARVVTVGSDADKDACQAILRGELWADVDKRPVDLGLASYQAALALARGRKVTVDKTVMNGKFKVPVKYTPVQLITKANVRSMKYRWPDLQ